MYMTRVLLRRKIAPNVIHGILSKAFPNKRSGETNENLWRIDILGYHYAFIIVSKEKPDLCQLENLIGKNSLAQEQTRKNLPPNKTIEYTPFIESLNVGQVWKFRLSANPVEHKKQKDSKERGKVYALRTITEQHEWLERQGSRNGFTINSCNIVNDSWIAINNIRIRSVSFDGILTISDIDTFRMALTHGIGRGKAYGCGLLTIVKIND